MNEFKFIEIGNEGQYQSSGGNQQGQSGSNNFQQSHQPSYPQTGGNDPNNFQSSGSGNPQQGNKYKKINKIFHKFKFIRIGLGGSGGSGFSHSSQHGNQNQMSSGSSSSSGGSGSYQMSGQGNSLRIDSV